MKVYIVTSGCYSDYHIEAVFTDKEKAKRYANFNSDRGIETYETDKAFNSPERIMVWYVPGDNSIRSMESIFYETEDYCYGDQFGFETEVSERLREDIEKNGTNSPLLLKIAQDRFAQFKARHAEMEENEFEGDEPETIMTITPEQGAKAFAKYAEMFNANFNKKAEE